MKNQSLFCISCPCKRDFAEHGRNMLIEIEKTTCSIFNSRICLLPKRRQFEKCRLGLGNPAWLQSMPGSTRRCQGCWRRDREKDRAVDRQSSACSARVRFQGLFDSWRFPKRSIDRTNSCRSRMQCSIRRIPRPVRRHIFRKRPPPPATHRRR